MTERDKRLGNGAKRKGARNRNLGERKINCTKINFALIMNLGHLGGSVG